MLQPSSARQEPHDDALAYMGAKNAEHKYHFSRRLVSTDRHPYQVTPTVEDRRALRSPRRPSRRPTFTYLDSMSLPRGHVLRPVAGAWRAFDDECRTPLRGLRPRRTTSSEGDLASLPTRRRL
jgi:hypothetical protein